MNTAECCYCSFTNIKLKNSFPILKNNKKEQEMRRLNCKSNRLLRLSSSSSSLLYYNRRSYHYKGLDESDPFGEKIGWDAHPAMGSWQNVDIEALAEAVESDDIKNKHFGPDWTRVRSLAKAAAQKHGSFVKNTTNDNVADYESDAARSLGIEKERREKLAKEEEEMRAFEAEVKKREAKERRIMSSRETSFFNTPEAKEAQEMLQKGQNIIRSEKEEREMMMKSKQQQQNDIDEDEEEEKPLSEKLSPREIQAAKVIMYDDSKMPSRNVEQEEYVAAPTPKMEEIAGYRPPEALEVPKSIRVEEDDDDEDENDIDEDEDDDETTEQQQDVPRDTLGFPLSDPLHWKTDDIILWVDNFGPHDLDSDLLDAFKMTNVDGYFLLEKINPPDLFKAIRKWHLGGRKAAFTADREDKVPLISVTTIQEQAILSFPYGPP